MVLTYPIINVMLAQEDIEGLIEAGAPADEYMDEAAQITAALLLLSKDAVTKDNITAIISLVWIKSFNLSESDMKLRLLAIKRIAERIASNGV